MSEPEPAPPADKVAWLTVTCRCGTQWSVPCPDLRDMEGCLRELSALGWGHDWQGIRLCPQCSREARGGAAA